MLNACVKPLATTKPKMESQGGEMPAKGNGNEQSEGKLVLIKERRDVKTLYVKFCYSYALFPIQTLLHNLPNSTVFTIARREA